MEREPLIIEDTWKVIDAKNACIDYSKFVNVGAEHMYLENISLVGLKISDANLTNVEIKNAQISGAYFHNIGFPVEGEEHFNPANIRKPVRFENCDLLDTQISDCNLDGVTIVDCSIQGMKINGILVEDLLEAYHAKEKL